MKLTILILLSAACQMFAGDDTNYIAAGDWSQPVATRNGTALRGRLLICNNPNPETDTAIFLELQNVSSTRKSVWLYCNLGPISKSNLHCEIHDSAGKLIPERPNDISTVSWGSSWFRLEPNCSDRQMVSYFYASGRLDKDHWLHDGGLAVYLTTGQWWDAPPTKTNEYYLSGTFTGFTPEEVFAQTHSRENHSDNSDVWSSTLTLPPLKLTVKEP